jgi:hypothetical protein
VQEPSKENGHKFAGSKEFANDEDTLSCRDEDSNWRDKIPPHTLEIYTAPDPDDSSHSTVGYIKESLDDDAGRRSMAIFHRQDVSEQIIDAAHELGHVIGLV